MKLITQKDVLATAWSASDHACTSRNTKWTAIAVASAVLALSAGSALAISQSGESKNMTRVGHTDLQGRPSYQPNVIQYPDGRIMLFVGTHGGSAPNPLNHNVVEQNGTIIIDVTDPRNPVEKVHIPVPVAGGQAQMVRMCLGSQLPGGQAGNVYLLRNIQGSTASGYELWDVSNPGVAAPVLLKAQRNLRTTHKDWWECTTGIAYMPGSKNAILSGAVPLWKTSQAMLIFDWSNPHTNNHATCGNNLLALDGATVGCPEYIRTYGPVGAQPDAVNTPSPLAAPPSLHGAISGLEHPQAAQQLARGAGPNDVVGNRIYAAWGVGDDGILQVIDRKKLLPSTKGGTWGPSALGPGDPDRPTVAEIEDAQTSLLYMSPDQGGHTSMPVFGMKPGSFQCHKEFQARDIVILTSEATADRCDEAPHPAFLVDVTVENSKTAPPGTKVEQYKWQGPMVLSTMWVDPRSGEKYPRGNYCTRGARFGVHSSEENFNNPYYGRLTFLAYFTGGIRAWDIREPYTPVEVGFYVPENDALTNTANGGYMTNNVEVDNRGFIYVVDRNGSGMDIIGLQGPAQQIGLGMPNQDTGACVNNLP
jgi:hypothetical protein